MYNSYSYTLWVVEKSINEIYNYYVYNIIMYCVLRACGGAYTSIT